MNKSGRQEYLYNSGGKGSIHESEENVSVRSDPPILTQQDQQSHNLTIV